MRGAFGLVSLLMAVAIAAYLWANHTSAVSHQGSQLKEQVTQLSGHDAEGKSALQSIKTEPELDAAGHLKSLVVTDIVAGGAMDKFYGFEKGDKIITEGQYDVTTNGDADTASAMLLDAFEKFQPVEVIRGSAKMSLPIGGSAGKAAQDQFNQLQHVGQ